MTDFVKLVKYGMVLPLLMVVMGDAGGSDGSGDGGSDGSDGSDASGSDGSDGGVFCGSGGDGGGRWCPPRDGVQN